MTSAKKIIYGYHSIFSLLNKKPESVLQLFISAHRQDKRVEKLISLAKKDNISIQMVTKEKLTNRVGHTHHQGIIAYYKNVEHHHQEADLEKILLNGKITPLLVVLDGIHDPHNLGACIRTAEAAGATALIIPKDNSASITPTARKVACGAAEILPIITVTNLSRTLQKLKSKGVWLVGASSEAKTPIYKTDLTIPLALVFGNEEKGLRRLTKEQCDFLTSIPMQGAIESLNVSVAVGIFLFEATRQRTIAISY